MDRFSAPMAASSDLRSQAAADNHRQKLFNRSLHPERRASLFWAPAPAPDRALSPPTRRRCADIPSNDPDPLFLEISIAETIHKREIQNTTLGKSSEHGLETSRCGR